MSRAFGLAQAPRPYLWVLASTVAVVLAGSGSAFAVASPAAAAGHSNLSAEHRSAARTETRTLRVPATVATYVESFHPDGHFGDPPAIKAGRSHRGRALSYLRFVVTGLPSAATGISARVALSPRVRGRSVVRLRHVSDRRWSPHRVTWRTRPHAGRRLASAAAGRAARPVTLTADNVQRDGVYDFTVSSPSSRIARFRGPSRGTGPILVVRYVAATPSTVPTANRPPSSPPPPASSPTPTPTPTPTESSPSPTDPSAPGCSVSAILVPSCGAWIGVDPGAYSTTPKDVALAEFETEIGRSVDIVHSYHTGAQRFPDPLEVAEATQPGANRMLLINWKPELGDSWAQVAAGDPRVDANIDQEAAYIKSHFTSTFFLAIHHEPENEVIETPGSGYTASDYAAMYRHVEDRLRADGVTNIVYVMNYMGYYRWGQQPWFTQLYPGDSYVDWISWDPYTSAATASNDFAGLLNDAHGSWPGFYNWATSFAPGKPLMLSEWGVTTNAAPPAQKPWFFGTVASELSSYPALKALVYFDSSAPGGLTIASSPQSVAAFAALAHQPEFGVVVPAQRA